MRNGPKPETFWPNDQRGMLPLDFAWIIRSCGKPTQNPTTAAKQVAFGIERTYSVPDKCSLDLAQK